MIKLLKNVFKFLTSKLVIVAFLILVQILLIAYGIDAIRILYIGLYNYLVTASVILAIYVANREDNPSYRLTWIMLILASPVFGMAIYFIFGARKVPKALRERDTTLQKDMLNYIAAEIPVREKLKDDSEAAYKQSEYIWNSAAFPMYLHTETKYFAEGADFFDSMLDDLEKAEKFIFMEYFIIAEGYLWDKILEILKRKASDGVDVRIIYDDFGCIEYLPGNYFKQLRKMGIQAKTFNPVKPRLAIQMNNRDHRKIVVVDGKVGYTGGVNIADEYINRIKRFGHWKDGGCKINGEAVWSMTLMFLQFWNYDEDVKDNYTDYQVDKEEFEDIPTDGLVQPFSDTPTDDNNLGECTHLNLINNANKYVYIATPYLVIDQEMKNALIMAVRNGIDVRICVPHIPDKWYVFELTCHYYEQLTKHGIRVYEYTPGFIHEKTYISDDRFAVIGTTNMDYRSYYLHYECGVWFYKSSLIKDAKEDYLKTLAQSQEITYEDCKNVNIFRRVIRALLNIIAPLM